MIKDIGWAILIALSCAILVIALMRMGSGVSLFAEVLPIIRPMAQIALWMITIGYLMEIKELLIK